MFTEKTAIALLRKKQQELGRTPQRSDFTSLEVSQIKNKLGPWPRALEKAGLKEPGARVIQKEIRKKERKLAKAAAKENA